MKSLVRFALVALPFVFGVAPARALDLGKALDKAASAISQDPTPEEAAKYVKEDMQRSLDEDETYRAFGLKVVSVELKDAENGDYRGFAAVSLDDTPHKVRLKVSPAGEGYTWETTPGAFAWVFEQEPK